MTKADTKAWRELYGKLCAIYDREFDEAQSRFYYDALKVFALVELEAVAVQLALASKWFPKPAEWAFAVVKRRIDRQRKTDLALAGQRLTPEVHCSDCRDTGWKGEDVFTVCPCQATNPNYQKVHAMGREAVPPDEDTPRLVKGRDFKQLASGE